SDLLNVQRELTNLQRQIDNLVGRQKYLKKSAEFTKLTIYLSTDELELPYTPTKAWRPKVIFKKAIRSLISNFRLLANLFIWVMVYSPFVLILWFIAKFFHHRNKQK
ncbi:hypothetical protein DRH14_02590, partial [Candidatus Shapirobacteria bacterium]